MNNQPKPIEPESLLPADFATTSALVVFSGGQDSTTCLSLCSQNFKKTHSLTFNYGQRHIFELTSAEVIGEMLLPLSQNHSSNVVGALAEIGPLMGVNGESPTHYESMERMEDEVGSNIEKTFVPMRNVLFLTIAVNKALELGCKYVVTGVSAADNANYPDCTEQFINDFQLMTDAALGGRRVEILTPLLKLDKSETVILASQIPGCFEALAYSHTSYDGEYPPVKMNHSNILRAWGFEKAGFPDPLVMRAYREGLLSELPATKNYGGFNV